MSGCWNCPIEPDSFQPPHLARAKWVQVKQSSKVNGKELHVLIRRDYELVRGRLPKQLQQELTDPDRGVSLPK